jgi:hypothetical protein
VTSQISLISKYPSIMKCCPSLDVKQSWNLVLRMRVYFTLCFVQAHCCLLVMKLTCSGIALKQQWAVMGRIRILLLEDLICYVQRMYRTPLLSATNFAEEILPGADLFPTATMGKDCFRLYLSKGCSEKYEAQRSSWNYALVPRPYLDCPSADFEGCGTSLTASTTGFSPSELSPCLCRMVLRVSSAVGVGIESAFPWINPGKKEKAEDLFLLLMALCNKDTSLYQDRYMHGHPCRSNTLNTVHKHGLCCESETAVMACCTWHTLTWEFEYVCTLVGGGPCCTQLILERK